MPSSSDGRLVMGNLHAIDLVAQALGGVTIHHAEKRRGAGNHAGGAEKRAARGIGHKIQTGLRA